MRLDELTPIPGAGLGSSRIDRDTRFSMGATPIRTTDEGWKIYEGTATMGDVILPYANPTRLEFRPKEEATSPAAIETMEGVPITNNHPDDLLDPDTVKEHTEGAVLKVWLKDGEYPKIRVRVVIYTRQLQEEVEGGKVELSPGYNQESRVERGDFKGQPFHVVQTNVRYNHLAVVDNARTRSPSGDVARLDKDDTMNLKNTGEAGSADAKDKTRSDAEDKTRVDAARTDMLSEEAMTLVAKMPEDDQKVLLASLETENVDEEIVDEKAEEEEKDEKEETMDMQAQIDKLTADMAAMNDSRGDSADSGHRLDAAKIIRQAEDKARAAAEKQTSTLLADRALCAEAGLRLDGFGSDDAFTAMIAVIKEHAPNLSDAAGRALKGGRLDDVRDFFKTAAASGKSARADSNAEELGEIFKAPDADAKIALSSNIPL